MNDWILEINNDRVKILNTPIGRTIFMQYPGVKLNLTQFNTNSITITSNTKWNIDKLISLPQTRIL